MFYYGQMLGAKLFALSALGTFICSCPMAFCYAPQITFLFHLFITAAEYLFFIVKLHIRRYRNILGTVVTISATGTSRIHIISYFFSDFFQICISKRQGFIGHVAGHIDMFTGGKIIKHYRYLWTGY